MRLFYLVRTEDVTGTSGTGIVAEGVQFTDGTVVLRWVCGPATSTCVYVSLYDLLAIHGHEGRTHIEPLEAQGGTTP